MAATENIGKFRLTMQAQYLQGVFTCMTYFLQLPIFLVRITFA